MGALRRHAEVDGDRRWLLKVGPVALPQVLVIDLYQCQNLPCLLPWSMTNHRDLPLSSPVLGHVVLDAVDRLGQLHYLRLK
jgi:hypothetical protein